MKKKKKENKTKEKDLKKGSKLKSDLKKRPQNDLIE